MYDMRGLEELDPLKGNSLIVIDDSVDTEIAIFSAGPSSSNLGIAIISTDKVTIIETIGLEYPIRQIQLSPLSTAHTKIILIRTTSSIHLIHLDQDRKIIPKHRLFLPDFSDIHRKVDYSMPIHAEPSPFYNDQYLFTTNNGYTALMDASNNKVLFEDLDPISKDTPYKSRWRSCGFGKTPFTIYTVTPDCLKEFVIRHDNITSKILAIPNERIVAFQTTQHSLYCFATTTSIAVMDRMYPERPLVTWLHRMRDGPPTDILINRLLDDKWRITAFSKHTQRYTMISLHYINSPTKHCKPIIKILELFNFTLPVLKFEEIFNYKSRINSVGCSIRTRSQSEHDTTQGNLVLSIYRSFEDGSIRVNYIELASDQHHTTFTGHPITVVSQSESFDQLMKDLRRDLLPEREPRKCASEAVTIKVHGIREYLESIQPGSQPLEDAFKREIVEKSRLI
ncbi:hypothetical protein EDC94DRAFT_33397 [Helicostylum pulchrum]|nr:hypothetical protein EDC94DRAFT_33397 [Helicostylum pulchrum]